MQIKRLEQMDNHTFTIEWSDGQVNDYHLSTLQQRCPCANCTDEQTGKRRVGIKNIENVGAQRIVSVGRYALRVYFTSGCSAGIFGFDMLRNL
ncbi:MAG: DUF971 domain-containing protein [Parachlamydiaceae bacterium]|nr:DUF971 domain-containing protein [Parachlamydiaceae bacterium]